MKCIKCQKYFKGNSDYRICPVCYALSRSKDILEFEEKNKLPRLTSSSQNKIIEARLYRMWILGNIYGAYKSGNHPEMLAHYQNFRTFNTASFWISYYNKRGSKIDG